MTVNCVGRCAVCSLPFGNGISGANGDRCSSSACVSQFNLPARPLGVESWQLSFQTTQHRESARKALQARYSPRSRQRAATQHSTAHQTESSSRDLERFLHPQPKPHAHTQYAVVECSFSLSEVVALHARHEEEQVLLCRRPSLKSTMTTTTTSAVKTKEQGRLVNLTLV